jgi:hypothetical protein
MVILVSCNQWDPNTSTTSATSTTGTSVKKWIHQEGTVIIQNNIYITHSQFGHYYYKSHICFKYNVSNLESNVEYIKCCNGYFSHIKNKNVTIYVNANDPYDAYIDMKYRFILGPIFTFVIILGIYYFNRLPRVRFRSPIEFNFTDC